MACGLCERFRAFSGAPTLAKLLRHECFSRDKGSLLAAILTFSSGSTVRAAETVLRVAIPSLFRALFFILSHYMTVEKAEHWLEAGHVAVP